MPTISFFPWMTITEPLSVGDFQLVPCSSVLADPSIPQQTCGAISEILQTFGHKRKVDRDSIPFLRHRSAEFLSEIDDVRIGRYFSFRLNVAFAILSARRYFDHRYANSDDTKLVVQRFAEDRLGATSLVSRRRDGTATSIVAHDSLLVRRPDHVSGWCEIPRDLDLDLLVALERLGSGSSRLGPLVCDAVRLFVGANTDSPDVGLHSELVDVVSAFSRLAEDWTEDQTAREFHRTVPSPTTDVLLPQGTSSRSGRVAARTAESAKRKQSVRELWLRDAYRLRGDVSHGQVTNPPYPSLWTLHEHLLLASVALPLYVKRLLHLEGAYSWSERDEEWTEAFDALALTEPFVDNGQSWNEVIRQVLILRLARILPE